MKSPNKEIEAQVEELEDWWNNYCPEINYGDFGFRIKLALYQAHQAGEQRGLEKSQEVLDEMMELASTEAYKRGYAEGAVSYLTK